MPLHPWLARLAGRPMALAPRALDGLLALSPEARGPMLQLRGEDRDAASYVLTEDGIAVVPVLGPLLTRRDWLTALIGGPTMARSAAHWKRPSPIPPPRRLCSSWTRLAVTSAGSSTSSTGSARESSGKPLWAVAGEAALSAPYAIASAADRLYVTRTAGIGSVGIVAVHVDESGADALAGRKWTLVHAGDRKTDGNPHEPLSDGARGFIRADVDALQP